MGPSIQLAYADQYAPSTLVPPALFLAHLYTYKSLILCACVRLFSIFLKTLRATAYIFTYSLTFFLSTPYSLSLNISSNISQVIHD